MINWIKRLIEKLRGSSYGVKTHQTNREIIHERILAGSHSPAMFLPEPGNPSRGTPRFKIVERYVVCKDQLIRIRGEFPFLAEAKTVLEPGGIIVLSIDVNDAEDFFGKARQWFQSNYQKLTRISRTTQAIMGVKKEVGFSLGNLFRGRYVDDTGKIFDERSFSVEVAGVDSESLRDIAEALRKVFNQRSVLVRDYSSNQTYLWDARPEKTDYPEDTGPLDTLEY